MKKEMHLNKMWLVDLPEKEMESLRQNLPAEMKFILMEESQAEERLAGIDATEDLLILTSSQKILTMAAERDIPAVGYQKPESDYFLSAEMVVEGFEEIDFTFLQHVYERHYHIPWTILETDRCIVREMDLSDLDDLFEMYREKGMTDYMEGLYPYEEELAYQKAYIENMYRFYGYGMWLVFEKQTGKLIGRAGVERREELNGEMELGYAIRTSCQNMGYAYEVCRAMIAYVQEVIQEPLLHCLIQKGNDKSEGLARKLGFQFHEEREQNGVLMSDFVKVLSVDF